MDRKKWVSLLVYVGLPCIGLVVDLLRPGALDALCLPLLSPNRPNLPSENQIMSRVIPKTYLIRQFDPMPKWGDYPDRQRLGELV
jgi:hypothetical protein